MTTERLPSPIAIDGPAASGKSTLGRALAERLGYRFLDTGLMYRAFTLAALRAGVPASDADACARLARDLDLRVEAGVTSRVFLGGEDVTLLLRAPEVEASVSAYSVDPRVRERMVALQREVAREGPVVLAGRDIGTVVLPDAPVKFYLDASETARALRRSAQAGTWGAEQRAHEAHRDIRGRDLIDSSRPTSPLRPADDAHVIDTTFMSLEEVIEEALARLRCAAS
jgi:cytidylate kinase